MYAIKQKKKIYCDTTTSTLIDEYMEISGRQCSRSQCAWLKWWCHLFWPHFAGTWPPSRGRQPQWTLSDTTDTHLSFQMITKEFGFSGFMCMAHLPKSNFFSSTWWKQLCTFYILIWVYSCMEWDTRIWAMQGKRLSLCFIWKAIEEGWGLESETGKKGGKTRTKVGRDDILYRQNYIGMKKGMWECLRCQVVNQNIVSDKCTVDVILTSHFCLVFWQFLS